MVIGGGPMGMNVRCVPMCSSLTLACLVSLAILNIPGCARPSGRFYGAWDFGQMKGQDPVHEDAVVEGKEYFVHHPEEHKVTRIRTHRVGCCGLVERYQFYYGDDAIRLTIEADDLILREGHGLSVTLRLSSPFQLLMFSDGGVFCRIRRRDDTKVLRDVPPIDVTFVEGGTRVMNWQSEHGLIKPSVAELPSGEYEIWFELHAATPPSLPALGDAYWVGRTRSNKLSFKIAQ